MGRRKKPKAPERVTVHLTDPQIDLVRKEIRRGVELGRRLVTMASTRLDVATLTGKPSGDRDLAMLAQIAGAQAVLAVQFDHAETQLRLLAAKLVRDTTEVLRAPPEPPPAIVKPTNPKPSAGDPTS